MGKVNMQKSEPEAPEVIEPKAPEVIEPVRLIKIARGDKNYPAIIYNGEAPQIGETLLMRLDNGVTYTGTVYDMTAVSGEVLVEFTDGISPVQE